jgi:hypothetical protein
MSVCVGKQRQRDECKYPPRRGGPAQRKVTRMTARFFFISNLPFLRTFIFLFADWLLTCKNKSCKSAERGKMEREKLQERREWRVCVVLSLLASSTLPLCVSWANVTYSWRCQAACVYYMRARLRAVADTGGVVFHLKLRPKYTPHTNPHPAECAVRAPFIRWITARLGVIGISMSTAFIVSLSRGRL